MKSRFLEKQSPIKFVELCGEIYVFICLNEEEKEEIYTDFQDNKGVPTKFYEYDYNEFHDKKENLNLDDIKNNPDKYLNYPKEEKNNNDRIKELEELNTELSETLDDILTNILPSIMNN